MKVNKPVAMLLVENGELRDEISALKAKIERQREDIDHHKSVADTLFDTRVNLRKRHGRQREALDAVFKHLAAVKSRDVEFNMDALVLKLSSTMVSDVGVSKMEIVEGNNI